MRKAPCGEGVRLGSFSDEDPLAQSFELLKQIASISIEPGVKVEVTTADA